MLMATDTLGNLQPNGYRLFVTGHNQTCPVHGKTRQIDVAALVERLRPDHPAMAPNLKKVMNCGKFGAKDFGLTLIPRY